MGFITLENYYKVWQADAQKKRDIYGKDGPDDAAGLVAAKQDDTQFPPVPPGVLSRSHSLLQSGWRLGLG